MDESGKDVQVNFFREEVGISERRRMGELDFQYEPAGGSIDDTFKNQMERVKREGNHEMIFLDIGSGDGRLLSDLYEDSIFFKDSGKFLVDNPSFSIRAIGLTDAPTVALFNQERPLNFDSPSDLDNIPWRGQIDAKNYYWTLSVRQKLSDFLDARKVSNLDLVYAGFSIMYFSPTLFKEVLETVISRMNPGAKMVCIPFAGNDAIGFTGFDSTARFNENPDAKIEKGKKRSWKDLMRECVTGIPMDNEEKVINSWKRISHSELQNEFNEVKKTYQRLGVLTDEEINQISSLCETEGDIFSRTIYKVLTRGFENLRKKKLAEVLVEKERIISNLQRVDILRFGKSGIALTKR